MSENINLYKTCSKCKKIKHLENFHIQTNCCKICRTEYYIVNREKIKIKEKKYREKNKNEINRKKRLRYRQFGKSKGKKIINFSIKKYIKSEQKRKLNKRKYVSERRKKDINFKILNNLRARINSAIKKFKKSYKTKELVGLSINELKNHIESQFKEGMSWENYGIKGWHIDHIKPCSSFDLTDIKQQKQCFCYTNLQPLWWWENLEKGDKIIN